ncbi:MAG: hypothetical protein VKI63_05730 [Cyanobium sp.]|nr:hypothetical protein [Cyanobium sp.]
MTGFLDRRRRCFSAPATGRAAHGALLLALLATGGSLSARTPQAGSATSESIWDRADALEQARRQVPAGATVLREFCNEIEVGMGNTRYRCSVDWRLAAPAGTPLPPAGPSETGTDPANGAPQGR